MNFIYNYKCAIASLIMFMQVFFGFVVLLSLTKLRFAGLIMSFDSPDEAMVVDCNLCIELGNIMIGWVHERQNTS